MVRHGHRIALEVMGTMIEIADVAWNALEHRREHMAVTEVEEEEIARLQSENHCIKSLLAEHVPLLHYISQVPSLAGDCPSDLKLYTRLVALVNSPNFLEALESLKKNLEAGSNGGLPCNKYPDPNALDGLIHADEGDLDRWVLVTHDRAPHHLEEVSGIDNENYVVISQENAVDGIAKFIARCILENLKSKALRSMIESPRGCGRGRGRGRGWAPLNRTIERSSYMKFEEEIDAPPQHGHHPIVEIEAVEKAKEDDGQSIKASLQPTDVVTSGGGKALTKYAEDCDAWPSPDAVSNLGIQPSYLVNLNMHIDEDEDCDNED